MPTPPLHHLFHPDNLTDYTTALTHGLDHLTEQVRRVSGPVTGLSHDLAGRCSTPAPRSRRSRGCGWTTRSGSTSPPTPRT